MVSKRILHIHQDYPDGRVYPCTRAVANLIDAVENETRSIEHFVLSINRTSNPLNISIKKFDQGLSVVYWAIPLPYIYLPVMWLWSLIFLRLLKSSNFDLVHAHKLTTEGLVGEYIARKRGIPYVISVRGGSDSHNINRLPCCRKVFKRIAENAFHIFFVSPWMKNRYPDYFLNESNTKLPNICEYSKSVSNIDNRNNKYISVLSFHQYKRKGILPLIKSISLLRDEGFYVCLDVYGTGNAAYRKVISDYIEELGCQDQIDLKGEVPRDDLVSALKKSKGLLLPAANETFGMVYIEALMAGVPILYHQNTGVDGYFDDNDIGTKVASQDVFEIKDRVKELVLSNEFFSNQVNLLISSNDFDLFYTNNIVKEYLSVVGA
ncbi:glycosyltransferase [Litoribrevibacter albus]|uniref:Glycosyltransferase n=1 Tax=Litoribrevibacter albus TaxID=1473156 RepID=A0AA37W755_9GAMM|nr:glycosyltransferase [Litoribrevibacter albus]GLQ30281.1 hypothetical protein GCM10007876_07590 [Litoribrevibacter albus]